MPNPLRGEHPIYKELYPGPNIPLEFQRIPLEIQWNAVRALVEKFSYGEWLSVEFHWNSSGNSHSRQLPNSRHVY